MSEKISKDGNRLTVTEYECRLINCDGDAVNVSHAETSIEAIKQAKCHIEAGGVAAVVEKHVSRYPAHLYSNPSVYTTIATFGNATALAAGGWKE